MRILMLAQSYAPIVGGEERVVQDLSRELVGRGHDVAVATLSPESETGDDGVSVHQLRSSVRRIPRPSRDAERHHAVPAPDPETIVDLRRVVAQVRPDVVHAHNWIAHSYVPLHGARSAPLVVSLHDYDLICATKRLFYREAVCSGPGLRKCIECAGDHFGRAGGTMLAMGMKLTVPVLDRATDMFIAVSDAVRRGCGLGSDGRARVIPNFVRPLPAAPAANDGRLSSLPKEPYILFLGDATVDKGARNLAAVYRHIADPPPLVFVGRCFVDDLREVPGVVVTGQMPHEFAMEAVRRSLFTVAPSLWAEPFGIVALEAAAAGKAILASCLGGLPDVVIHGETGLLVDPSDSEAMKQGLRRLIENPGLRESFGQAGQERANLCFSADTVVPQFETAYATAIASRRLRSKGD